MSDIAIQRYKGWGCRVVSLTLAFIAVLFVGLQLSSVAPTCRLTYEHNTVVTEAVLLKEAAKAGWPLTHPECNVCVDAADGPRVPIWIAPGDVCTMRPALRGSWIFCEGSYMGTEFAADEHVKVRASRDALKSLWDASTCHLSSPTSSPTISPTDDFFALVSDNKMLSDVNVGYDGTLFCAGLDVVSPPPSPPSYEIHHKTTSGAIEAVTNEFTGTCNEGIILAHEKFRSMHGERVITKVRTSTTICCDASDMMRHPSINDCLLSPQEQHWTPPNSKLSTHEDSTIYFMVGKDNHSQSYNGTCADGIISARRALNVFATKVFSPYYNQLTPESYSIVDVYDTSGKSCCTNTKCAYNGAVVSEYGFVFDEKMTPDGLTDPNYDFNNPFCRQHCDQGDKSGFNDPNGYGIAYTWPFGKATGGFLTRATFKENERLNTTSIAIPLFNAPETCKRNPGINCWNKMFITPCFRYNLPVHGVESSLNGSESVLFHFNNKNTWVKELYSHQCVCASTCAGSWCIDENECANVNTNHTIKMDGVWMQLSYEQTTFADTKGLTCPSYGVVAPSRSAKTYTCLKR